jgi:Cof subfamily protein (haloacid dehalogenase superfamily)
MYKIIALDLDGTLLNSKHKISAYTKEVIALAMAQGIKVVLASGRPLTGMRPLLDELGLTGDDDYVCHFNGAVVEKVGSGVVVNSKIIDGAAAKKVARVAKKLGVNVHAFSQEFGLITPVISAYTELEASLNGIDIHLMDFNSLEDSHPITKVMMIDEDEKITAAIEQLPKALYKEFMIVRSAPWFLEFLNPECNKGVGIKMIADYLNVPAEQVMCIGDAENDHHMLKYAGLSVAMANATQATKAIADYITLSNDEDGVAHAIKKFALKSY